MSDRETKIRKKLRSYRSARVGCIFLAIVSALVLVMQLATGQSENASMAPAYASTLFWPALAYICHLKIKLLRVELSDEDAR